MQLVKYISCHLEPLVEPDKDPIDDKDLASGDMTSSFISSEYYRHHHQQLTKNQEISTNERLSSSVPIVTRTYDYMGPGYCIVMPSDMKQDHGMSANGRKAFGSTAQVSQSSQSSQGGENASIAEINSSSDSADVTQTQVETLSMNKAIFGSVLIEIMTYLLKILTTPSSNQALKESNAFHISSSIDMASPSESRSIISYVFYCLFTPFMSESCDNISATTTMDESTENHDESTKQSKSYHDRLSSPSPQGMKSMDTNDIAVNVAAFFSFPENIQSQWIQLLNRLFNRFYRECILVQKSLQILKKLSNIQQFVAEVVKGPITPNKQAIDEDDSSRSIHSIYSILKGSDIDETNSQNMRQSKSEKRYTRMGKYLSEANTKECLTIVRGLRSMNSHLGSSILSFLYDESLVTSYNRWKSCLMRYTNDIEIEYSKSSPAWKHSQQLIDKMVAIEQRFAGLYENPSIVNHILEMADIMRVRAQEEARKSTLMNGICCFNGDYEDGKHLSYEDICMMYRFVSDTLESGRGYLVIILEAHKKAESENNPKCMTPTQPFQEKQDSHLSGKRKSTGKLLEQ